MADMTARHHKLIEDAINEGVANAVKRICGNLGPNEFCSRTPTYITSVMRIELAQSFASRLAYTHDKFEAEQFKRHITGKI